MNNKTVYIHDNGNDKSIPVAKTLAKLLSDRGFDIAESYSEDIAFLVCIGGDGTFLRMLHQYDFPSMPIVGIHTGHLGFFQEFLPEELSDFADVLASGNYSIQEHRLIEAKVETKDKAEHLFKAVNDVVVKGSRSTLIHLDMSITDSFLEHFSGDGILFAAPAGSTAYNYSLGGSIVDPRVSLLQVTPIAPMNTNVFRSFTSSIMLPPASQVHVKLDESFQDSCVLVADGAEVEFADIEDIKINLGNDSIKLLRKKDYDFWATVKSKFF